MYNLMKQINLFYFQVTLFIHTNRNNNALKRELEKLEHPSKTMALKILNHKTIDVASLIGYRVIAHGNKRGISHIVSVILINIAALSQLR